jgi:hypothetical protein
MQNKNYLTKIQHGLLVQLNWPVSSYTRDLINILADSGYTMDFVTTSRSITPYLDISKIKAKVTILFGMYPWIYSFFWKLWRVFSILFSIIPPLDPIVLQAIIRILNNQKYDLYKSLADSEKNVIFGGRLAEYKYYDMHQVIASALKKINEII